MSWMGCPKCGYEHTVVGRVMLEGTGGVVRERRCGKCGLDFETVEQVRAVVRRQVWQAALWSVLSKEEVGGG